MCDTVTRIASDGGYRPSTASSFFDGEPIGQFVIAIPALDLVVRISGGAYGEFDQWYRWELELVPEFIIPAVENPAKRPSVPN